RHERVGWKGRARVLRLVRDRVFVQNESIRALLDRPQANGSEAVMMPVFVRESLQPPRSHSVKDVAVEEPFEEAKEQVHRQKRRDERGHASGELARPQLGKERMIAGKQKHELKKGEKRKAQDGKATPIAMCHGARVRRTVVSSGASAAQPARRATKRVWRSAERKK